jgi:low affinity Fe/Cu permease
MAKRKNKTNGNIFERASQAITGFTGSTTAFIIACFVIIVWGVTGPIFNYSDTWQLVINTGTTVITFLMVFLIQRTQNKDAMAMQMKLNEIVAAIKGASNRLVDVEDLSENDLKLLHKHYQKLADIAEKEDSLHNSHSVEEAVERHEKKQKEKKQNK